MSENARYVGRDLPFVNDPSLQAIGAHAGALRASIAKGFTSLIAPFRSRVTGPPFFMCAGVLPRMLECALSIEVLASKGRQRDAAVLVLTLSELRLDLQYAAQDFTRASVWLANAEKGRKPWRVRTQIEAIHREPRVRAAELANYRNRPVITVFRSLALSA